MSYIVVIPSFKRYQSLKDKTLKTLKEGGVPSKIVHVFVANKEEEQEYRKVLKSEYKIVVGVKGITNQRKFIIKYFPEGTRIVSLDDDVEQLLQLQGEKTSKLTDVHGFFKQAFKDLKKHKLHVFGVYPTPNPFYMKGQKPVTTTLKFVIGGLHGYINRHSKDLEPSVEADQKEDIHFSILAYIKDGGILRYNHIGFKTKFKAEGGLGKFEERLGQNKLAAEFLAAKYPHYASVKVRPNGMYEISLRDRSKKT